MLDKIQKRGNDVKKSQTLEPISSVKEHHTIQKKSVSSNLVCHLVAVNISFQSTQKRTVLFPCYKIIINVIQNCFDSVYSGTRKL